MSLSLSAELTRLPLDHQHEMARILLKLHKAWCDAHSFGSDPWEFAIRLDSLLPADQPRTDLLWLLRQGYVQQPDPTRGLRRTTQLILAADAAEDLAPWLTYFRLAQAQPRWDRDGWQLFLGKLLVKKFTRRAPNQMPVLDAFEELHWHERIDDPLPGKAEQDRHERLGEAVRELNGHRIHPVLRFSRDGSGNGIRWERVLPSPKANETSRRSASGTHSSDHKKTCNCSGTKVHFLFILKECRAPFGPLMLPCRRDEQP